MAPYADPRPRCNGYPVLGLYPIRAKSSWCGDPLHPELGAGLKSYSANNIMHITTSFGQGVTCTCLSNVMPDRTLLHQFSLSPLALTLFVLLLSYQGMGKCHTTLYQLKKTSHKIDAVWHQANPPCTCPARLNSTRFNLRPTQQALSFTRSLTGLTHDH